MLIALLQVFTADRRTKTLSFAAQRICRLPCLTTPCVLRCVPLLACCRFLPLTEEPRFYRSPHREFAAHLASQHLACCVACLYIATQPLTVSVLQSSLSGLSLALVCLVKGRRLASSGLATPRNKADGREPPVSMQHKMARTCPA